MKFEDLLDAVGEEPVFESGLLLVGDVNAADVRRQLSRWTRSGKIVQLRRGLYALAPPYRKVKPHPFVLANRLVPASYVSVESALAHHGMIPEHVPQTVSVTAARPGERENVYGAFDFRNVRRGLFWGSELVELGGGQRAFVASPEKALLDRVHLTDGGGTEDHLRGLRLQNLERLDLARLAEFARRTSSPKIRRAARVIAELAEEDGEAAHP